MNSCPLFNSSRSQKIIVLSLFEAGLRAITSSASDGIYIRSVLEFALGTKVDHYVFVDSSSARQLVIERSWMESYCGFRTEKTSISYKYQQTTTWQTSVPSQLEARESDFSTRLLAQ